jgi:phosphoglucosamine mutase
MVSALTQHQADLGIAFDGDADRVVFVTPQGMLIDGDHTLALLAIAMKAAGTLRGDSVVATDMSNTGLEDHLKAHGIRFERTKVGDRYVMERLRANGFVLGGEQAGHIITLDENHTTGDGLYVGLLMARLVAQAKRQNNLSLHDMAARIPRYAQVIASTHLSQRVDLANLAELESRRDAARAAFGGRGRVNVRFSGTEPNLLRAMVEGGPESSLQTVIDHALAICHCVARASGNDNPHIDMVNCATGEPISTQTTQIG